MKFEWDYKKEELNLRKHGVSFEKASYVFADPYALDKFDEKHSGGEERWIILGKSLDETLLLVVHTYRNAKGVEFIRIISARKASKNEREAYNRRCVK
jgi:uncharacterized protein